MRSSVLVLTLSCAPFMMPMVHAQQALAPAPPQNREMPPDKIAKGEIGLDGRIKALTGPNSFDIEASSFTAEDGRVVEFEKARPKSIQATENALIASSDNLRRRLAMSKVKLGLRVRLIGRNVNGQPFQARLIVLSDVSSNYRTVRKVMVSAPVAALMRQGSEAFDAGVFNRALSFYKQAQGIAAGNNDKAGLSLALSRQGSAYKELNQLQKSEEAFVQAMKVAETGSPQSLPLLLSNYALLLRLLDRVPEGIALLERAHTLSVGEDNALKILVGSNLGTLYKDNKQWGKAIEAWNSIVNLLHVEGKLDREISILLEIARAHLYQKRTDENARYLALAQERFKVLSDPAQLAEAQTSFAVHYLYLGDKPRARPFMEQALAGFEALGDEVNAAQVREALNNAKQPTTSNGVAMP